MALNSRSKLKFIFAKTKIFLFHRHDKQKYFLHCFDFSGDEREISKNEKESKTSRQVLESDSEDETVVTGESELQPQEIQETLQYLTEIKRSLFQRHYLHWYPVEIMPLK